LLALRQFGSTAAATTKGIAAGLPGQSFHAAEMHVSAGLFCGQSSLFCAHTPSNLQKPPAPQYSGR
jgi:hypothetical protein